MIHFINQNDKQKIMEPIRINHGNVFGTGNWYTFYCPTCKRQIDSSMLQRNDGKCDCGQVIYLIYK